jgi:thioredoxin 1
MSAAAATSHGMLSLLEFTAAWCGPCKAMKPALVALAAEYRAPLTEIDVEHDVVTAQHYDVRATPTIVIVRDGVEVGRVVGVRSRAFLAGMLDRALAGDVAIASP